VDRKGRRQSPAAPPIALPVKGRSDTLTLPVARHPYFSALFLCYHDYLGQFLFK
jgi:hypothetical protein